MENRILISITESYKDEQNLEIFTTFFQVRIVILEKFFISVIQKYEPFTKLHDKSFSAEQVKILGTFT